MKLKVPSTALGTEMGFRLGYSDTMSDHLFLISYCFKNKESAAKEITNKYVLSEPK